MSFFSKALHSIKSVTHNKLFQVATGGLAVVFPVVGVPLAAGIATANKVSDGINSTNAATKAKAMAVLKETKRLADSGDHGAKRAYALINHVHKAKQGDKTSSAFLGKLQLAAQVKKAQAKRIVDCHGITRMGRIVRKPGMSTRKPLIRRVA